MNDNSFFRLNLKIDHNWMRLRYLNVWLFNFSIELNRHLFKLINAISTNCKSDAKYTHIFQNELQCTYNPLKSGAFVPKSNICNVFISTSVIQSHKHKFRTYFLCIHLKRFVSVDVTFLLAFFIICVAI